MMSHHLNLVEPTIIRSVNLNDLYTKWVC